MKKKILSFIVAGALAAGPILSYADEAVSNTSDSTTGLTDEVVMVDPGVTPDSFFYTMDKFIEDMQLAITSDSEKEAELLIEFAKERFSEAKAMTQEEKEEFLKEAIEDYMVKLESAQETVSEVVLTEDKTDEEEVDQSPENLVEELEDVIIVDGEIENDLDEETKEELEEKIDSAYLVAAVVRGLDVEQVKKLRVETKLGYGQIAHVFALAEQSGKTIDEVALLFTENKGFGEVAKELGIHPSDMKKKAGKEKKEENKGEIEEVEQIENEKSITPVDPSMDDTKNEKASLEKESQKIKKEKNKEVKSKKNNKEKVMKPIKKQNQGMNKMQGEGKGKEGKNK